LYFGFKLALYFLKWPEPRLLLLHHLKDVETILGFDDVTDFFGFERERRGLERSHSLTLDDPAEIATFWRRTRIFGVLLGQLGKVGARFYLFEKILGFRLKLLHLVRRFISGLN